MSKRYVLWHLVVPFGLLAFVTIVVSALVDSDWWQGVLVNFGSTFAGFAIAILYVDKVLRRGEEIEWSGVRQVATSELGNVARNFRCNVASLLGQIARSSNVDPPAPDYYDVEGYVLFRNWASSVDGSFLVDSSIEDLNRFVSLSTSCTAAIDRILSLHGKHLSPNEVTSAVDLQKVCREFQSTLNNLINFGSGFTAQYSSDPAPLKIAIAKLIPGWISNIQITAFTVQIYTNEVR